jgi:hypothetical protein
MKKMMLLGVAVVALVLVSAGVWAVMAYTARFSRTEPVGGSGQYVVQDKITGYIWQGCPAGLTGANCDTGTIITKTWADAQTYCNGLNWGGEATGWRLPDIKELSSIVESRKSSPSMDTTAFPATPSNNFWSSSSHARNSSNAWYVIFNYGFVDVYSKSSPNDVRCVHSGP